MHAYVAHIRAVAIVGSLAGLLAAGGFTLTLDAQRAPADGPSALTAHRPVVVRYCLTCHSDRLKAGGLTLETVASHEPAGHPEIWEKVVRKLRARQMPPIGTPRPDDATYDAVVASLETSLDRASAAAPNPGRTPTFRRLTRAEYRNSVRDLLGVDVDVATLLPADDASHGFDNVTVAELSPTLLGRYLSAAETVSALALGRTGPAPSGDTIRIPPDLTQEDHLEGLPIGTRGGALIDYAFPVDGEYEIQVRLARDRDELVEGLTEPHDLEVLMDRERLQLFTVTPPRRAAGSADAAPPSHEDIDRHLRVRVSVSAGTHAVGVAFLKKPSVLLETARQPYRARFNSYRHPRTQPAVYAVSIIGPYGAKGPAASSSRGPMVACRPTDGNRETCATQILTNIIRRAYRRPATPADLERPLQIYRAAAADAGFEAGLEMALSAVLVSPHFLFRVEHDPAGVAPKTAYRISDLELASRLSFFIWSSIPDDELLKLASAGKLHQRAVLASQVRRMLADSRAGALVTNFASQWLHLRNLASSTPDMRLYPDFDENLRRSFRRETELLFDSILREDRSVLDLLRADYTFLDERLARHYGIPHVYGSWFRRVGLDGSSARGGLLRHASILTVTSYATRTSPVVRGKWVLDNLLGVPPPPPLPDVPALKDNTVDGNLSVRQRLAEHRSNPTCAACHNLMDPVGLSLEKYDAIGRRREREADAPIDASGGLADGSRFDDVRGLEQALLRRPELFVSTVVEKLLTYGLGRGVEYYDGPAIREIVRASKPRAYRLSSLILGVVNSRPFQMRTSR